MVIIKTYTTILVAVVLIRLLRLIITIIIIIMEVTMISVAIMEDIITTEVLVEVVSMEDIIIMAEVSMEDTMEGIMVIFKRGLTLLANNSHHLIKIFHYLHRFFLLYISEILIKDLSNKVLYKFREIHSYIE